MDKSTYTKSDFVSVHKFAKQNNIDPKVAIQIAANLYKNHTVVNPKTSQDIPIIIKNRLSHHSDQFLVHPLGHDIFINKIKERISK